MSMTIEDRGDLKYAKELLENPSLASRIMNVLGVPIQKGFEKLPANWRAVVQKASVKAMETALDVAVTTFGDKSRAERASNLLHKIYAAVTGGAGGAFGLAGLPVELPITTTIMLRSIADIARSEGENIASGETKIACLEVFALGGRSRSDDASETGYFVMRAALAKAVSDAAKYLAQRKAVNETAPALIRLIAQIASRFGLVVSEKAAATAIPVVGAAGGVVVNTIFMDHFQDMARGHFIVRRLERVYGSALVRAEYERL